MQQEVEWPHQHKDEIKMRWGNLKEGDTFWLDGDYTNGKRIKYSPRWSTTRPWCVYSNGSAGPCFGYFVSAVRWFGNEYKPERFKPLVIHDVHQDQSTPVG